MSRARSTDDERNASDAINPVSQFELDHMERLGGKGSAAYQRLAERRREWERSETERDVEETRLRATREAKTAAEAKDRADAQEAERAAAMDAL